MKFIRTTGEQATRTEPSSTWMSLDLGALCRIEVSGADGLEDSVLLADGSLDHDPSCRNAVGEGEKIVGGKAEDAQSGVEHFVPVNGRVGPADGVAEFVVDLDAQKGARGEEDFAAESEPVGGAP